MDLAAGWGETPARVTPLQLSCPSRRPSFFFTLCSPPTLSSHISGCRPLTFSLPKLYVLDCGHPSGARADSRYLSTVSNRVRRWMGVRP